MKGNRRQENEKHCTALFSRSIICVLLVVVMGFMAQAYADDGGGINVNCYSQQGSGDSVGEVTVYEASQATATCNSVYYDCQGQCLGCFIDSDYSDTVCANAAGQLFLK
jgi:hypothetical protein